MKKTVCVIFGGASSEYEVSLMSSASILRNLDAEKFDVITLGITKDGRWMLYTGSIDDIENNTWHEHPDNCPAFISPDKATAGLVVLEKDGSCSICKIDVIFPVLHGKNGEDGTIQGLFQLSGIPYVGCDTAASAICMDKAVAHSLLASSNIEQAHYLWFYADRYEANGEKIRNKIAARLNFPVFVKPANAGSSVGISKVNSEEELDAAIRLAAENDSKIVVEEGIFGQEVECAVLGNRGKSKASV
ncbi:MAG: D-alanine--D-alanine ligase, partial [Clostridia bacterium]|nr:D-alanine--D-alanine ligase [Clostridia bacterium]